jgi:PAS domain S-box-containing protein
MQVIRAATPTTAPAPDFQEDSFGTLRINEMSMIQKESIVKELFENPKNIILVTDEEFNIRFASPSVETIFSINPISILGRNAFEFIPIEYHDTFRDCLAMEVGARTEELSLLTKEAEEVHFDVTVTRRTGQGEIRGFVVVMHDITSCRKAQMKLQNHNEQLDHFIFKTTHDLRAPLKSSMGLIALAEMEPDEYGKYLALIKSSLQRMDTLIEEVSNLYKNEKLQVKTERIDIRQLIQKEMDGLRNLPEVAEITVDIFVDGEVPFYSDPLRVTTIVANLLSNAIKYCDPAKQRKYVQVSAHVFPDKLFLTIEDNGIGMAREHQEKVFDIFYRAHSDKKGTGLGLYIVKDTISRLDGNIYLKSRQGEGSSFTVTLPNKPDESVFN